MNALSKALGQDITAYKVPVPFLGLDKQIQPLRGNMAIIFGSPGVGKSAFSLNWALRMEEHSCIISLDTDITTQAIRSASVLSGVHMDQVKADPKKWSKYLETYANKVRCYDLGMTVKDILSIIRAEEEFWGDPPALTIVDNVANLVRDGGYEEYRRIFVELHRVARMGNTCILALHHIGRGSATQVGKPLNLFSGQYSGEQEAELVLGLWRPSMENTDVNISVLKNRQGEAVPDGSMYSTLGFSPGNGRME